jgi:hypothetical protein
MKKDDWQLDQQQIHARLDSAIKRLGTGELSISQLIWVNFLLTSLQITRLAWSLLRCVKHSPSSKGQSKTSEEICQLTGILSKG